MKTNQFTFFIAFFSLLLSVNAQVNKDSLWTVWSDENNPVLDRLEAIGDMSNDSQGMYKPANLDTAYYHAQLQYKLAESHNLKKYMGRSLGNQGNYFMAKQKTNKSIELFYSAIKISEEVDDQYNIATSSYNIGINYFKLGNAVKAIPLFERASQIFEDLGEKRLQAHSLDKIGFLYVSQKDERSLEYLNKALAIREELLKEDDSPRDRMVVAMMKNHITSLYKSFGLIEDTTKDSLISTNDLEKLSLAPDAPIVLSKAGEQALVKGDAAQAEDNFNESIKQSEALESNTVTAAYLITAGQAYFNTEQYSKALHYFQKALKLANKEQIL